MNTTLNDTTNDETQTFLQDIAPVPMSLPPQVNKNLIIIKWSESIVIIMPVYPHFYFCAPSPTNCKACKACKAFFRTENFQHVLQCLQGYFMQFKSAQYCKPNDAFQVQTVIRGIYSEIVSLKKHHTYSAQINQYFKEQIHALAMSWYIAMNDA